MKKKKSNNPNTEAAALNLVLENISQGICVYDNKLCLRYWNHRYAEMLNFPPGFLKEGMSIEDIIYYKASQGEDGIDNPEEFIVKRMTQIKALKKDQPHIRDRMVSGGKYLEIRNHLMPDGGLVVTYTDVTRRKLEEEKNQKMALNDPLTGLANRHLFNQRLESAINLTHRNGGVIGLLLLDLDKFKMINDTHGHLAGDDLLVTVAERLVKAVRKIDTVARLGGDEFAVIVTNLKRPEEACKPAERIIQLLAKPITIDGKKIKISTSIGMCFYPHDDENVKELFRKADLALYAAKERRGTISRYNKKLENQRNDL